MTLIANRMVESREGATVTTDDSFDTQDVIARTLWAEARSQGVEGMIAVANVIQNRAENPGWWGHDLRGVCLAPMQFSCWNANDPQAKAIRSTTLAGPSFEKADAIAAAVMLDALKDITHGADHYRAEYVSPSWAQAKAPTFECGDTGSRHFFYKLGLTG